MIDCNKIQEYVFASTKLKGICNASLLLDEIETVKIRNLLLPSSAKLIRSGGGIVIAKFDNDNGANDFLSKARDIYRKHGLTITSHIIPATPTNFYNDVLKPLLDEINRKKESPEGTGFGLSTVLAVPCNASGKGAAWGVLRETYGSETREIRISNTEWMKYKPLRRTLHPIEEDLRNKFKGSEIPSDFGGIVLWRKGDIPEEKPPGTSEERILGIIYADINGLGGLTKYVAKNEDKYSKFCTSLREVLNDSVKETLESVIGAAITKKFNGSIPPGTALPFRILYIGGDDLAVAIKGCHAMDFAQELLKIFEEKSKQFISNSDMTDLPEHLTLSAGLVLAPYDYPIRNFNLIGRGLENRAKHTGRRNGTTPPPSLVDICLVKNNSIGTIQDIRRFKEVDGRLLYADPYSPAELEQIKIAARDLCSSAFPNSKLRKLPEIFSVPGEGAKYQYLNWWHGLKDKEKETFKRICCNLHLPEPPEIPFIQSKVDSRKSISPIMDVVELSGLYRLTI